MNLPVLQQDRAGHVVPADPELCVGNLHADAFGAVTDADGSAPFVTLGDMERDTRRVEQPRGGYGDLVQRPLDIARRVGDGTQDFGAAGLAILGGAQFGQQAGVLQRGRSLLDDRFVALGQTRLESSLEVGNRRLEVGQHVLGKRGHPPNPFRPVPRGYELK